MRDVLTLLVVVAVAGLLFLAAVLATREGDVLAEAPPDRPDLTLPDGSLDAADLDGVRFGLVLRGYRMSEVDLVLDRVGEELALRDARIAELEQERERLMAPPTPPAVAPPLPPAVAPPLPPAVESPPLLPAVESPPLPPAVEPSPSRDDFSFDFPELHAPEPAGAEVPEAVEPTQEPPPPPPGPMPPQP